MTPEQIKANKPDGAKYYAVLYGSTEYLKCEKDVWYFWNGFSWLSCSVNSVKQLDITVL